MTDLPMREDGQKPEGAGVVAQWAAWVHKS